MDFTTIALPLLTSIAVGALIGLEREKNKQNNKGISSIGIRTDILISLFGAIAALLGKTISPILFLICLGALLLLTIASYIYISIKFNKVGFTTEISTILVFLLGAMAMSGYAQLALILAIIITLVLSLREILHKAIYNISYLELYDTIKFAIIAFIILPFLPNQNFDDQLFKMIWPNLQIPTNFNQVQILNPYNIWFLVVLVSGISFLGYILSKVIGKTKGISISGLIGGLYSSTATSLSLARKSRQYPSITTPFVTGIVLACGISFIRTFIELRALNEELFMRTLVPISLMFAYLMIVGLFLLFRQKPDKITHTANFKTPFELTEALKLGGLIVGALLIAKILLTFLGLEYYYIIAGAMALFAIDDPITISTAAHAGKLIDMTNAKNIILMVLFLNMVQKVIMIHFIGNKKLTRQMVIIYGGLFLVSLAGFLYF
ncbi:MAG: MgtC/SapB family protein [Candidatus Gracilibacteria bacterium]|jgi:uncharacterized membrane protein (DUF4010 family)